MKSIKKVILGGLVLSVMASSMATAKTIELRDPKKPIEMYAFYGAAMICKGSSKMTAEQKMEFDQIYDYYFDLISKNGLHISNIDLAYTASAEKLGIERSFENEPSYSQCSKALKK